MDIQYKVIYTKRKSVAIVIKNNGEVHVRAPSSRFFDRKNIDKFILEKQDWIIKNINKVKQNKKESFIPKLSAKELIEKKKNARIFISNRVSEIAKKYNFRYSKFRLSSAKSRWGSCSSSGTISINWNLIFLSQDLLDYVIIHELCHTIHHNHSDKFWLEVSKILPNYKEKRSELKKFDLVF